MAKANYKKIYAQSLKIISFQSINLDTEYIEGGKSRPEKIMQILFSA